MMKYLLFFLLIGFTCQAQFLEDFENGIPGSMTQEYVEGEGDWQNCFWGSISRSGGVPCPMNGEVTAHFWVPFLNTSTSLTTPLLDLAGDDYRLSFLHAQKQWGQWLNPLTVEISTDAGANWVEIFFFDYDISAPTTSDFDLSSFSPTQQTMIRFVAESNFGYATLLDDIAIKPIPDYDVKLENVDMDYIVTGANVPVSGSLKNNGLNLISSVQLNWQDGNDGQIFSQEFLNLDLAAGDSYAFTHQDIWQTTPGLHEIKVWLTNLNGIDNDQDSYNDFIKIKANVASNEVAKQRVLYEEFTSSTCGPCYFFNTEIFTEEYLAENEESVALVKYQMSWPGNGDPYYTLEGGVRRTLYGIGGVPSLKLEGGEGREPDTETLQAKLDEAMQLPAYFTINATHDLSLGGTINTQIEIIPYLGDTFSVHVAVVEKHTEGNAQNNGETSFNNVMMKMLPDAQGTQVTFTPDEPVTLNLSTDLSDTFVEDIQDLEVLVFIQSNEYDHSVMQSQVSSLGTLGVSNFKLQDVSLYPNPSLGELRVLTDVEVDLSIYDLMGKKVYEKQAVDKNSVLQISALSTGAYMVVVEANDSYQTKKLIVE